MRSIQSSDAPPGESADKDDNPALPAAAPEGVVEEAYRRIQAEIAACALDNHRPADAVTLLAVSKTRTVDEIKRVYTVGARHFGENYLQDALPKLDALAHCPDIVWHYIGALQSNKTNDIAANFDWVHTVDRSKIARRLNNARSDAKTPLNICLQVNLHDEPQKAGCTPYELPDLIAGIAELPRLAMRGLMILPAVNVAPEQAFDETARLFEQLRTNSPPDALPDMTRWDTLSMGMSGDYHAAIAAGSTIVRIGTALFGPRANK